MSVCTARDTVQVGELTVDRTPVTNARYAEFVAATGHRPAAYWPRGICPSSLADHPVVGVDYFDALAYAIWAGGDLPTEMEWVLATGLEEPRAYAWGDSFDSERCNTVRSGVKGTTPVGTYPPAPSGCVDLCGNVWELTCSEYPGDNQSVIVKGGSWYDYPAHARIDARFSSRVHKGGTTVGFRLVYGRPMRLPEFLDADLAMSCIAWRRELAAPPAGPPVDSSEFEDIVSQLREEAEATVPRLEDESPTVTAAAVDQALEMFDSLEFEPDQLFSDWEPKAKQNTNYASTLLERMQTLVAERPYAVLSIALGLAILLVWAALSGSTATTARGQRTNFTAVDNPLARRAPPTAAGEDRAARRVRSHRQKPLQSALARIREGSPEQRAEAERYLIAHPDEARARARDLLAGSPSESTRASLRYVLAALDEQQETLEPRPQVTVAPPRDGLVIFCGRISDKLGDEIAMVRRTAAAENLPATVVFLDNGDPRLLARTYRAVLRDVRIYVDADRTLARLWGISGAPATLGLSDGRLRFAHDGSIGREQLGELVARLRDARRR